MSPQATSDRLVSGSLLCANVTTSCRSRRPARPDPRFPRRSHASSNGSVLLHSRSAYTPLAGAPARRPRQCASYGNSSTRARGGVRIQSVAFRERELVCFSLSHRSGSLIYILNCPMGRPAYSLGSRNARCGVMAGGRPDPARRHARFANSLRLARLGSGILPSVV